MTRFIQGMTLGAVLAGAVVIFADRQAAERTRELISIQVHDAAIQDALAMAYQLCNYQWANAHFHRRLTPWPGPSASH
jgi:hypothetical protein